MKVLSSSSIHCLSASWLWTLWSTASDFRYFDFPATPWTVRHNQSFVPKVVSVKEFYHNSIRENEQIKHSFLFLFFFKMDKVFSKWSHTQWLVEAQLYNTFTPIKSQCFLSRSRPGPFNINIKSANGSLMWILGYQRSVVLVVPVVGRIPYYHVLDKFL